MLDRAYTSLVAVQKETRNDDANQADWFETCINSASRFIEHYCNTDAVFALANRVEPPSGTKHHPPAGILMVGAASPVVR